MNKTKRRLLLASGILTILMSLGSVVIGALIALLGTVISALTLGIIDSISGSSTSDVMIVIFIIIGVVVALFVGIPLLICGIMLCRKPQKKDGSFSNHTASSVITILLMVFYFFAFIAAAIGAWPFIFTALLPISVVICLSVALTKKHNQTVAPAAAGAGESQQAEQPKTADEIV